MFFLLRAALGRLARGLVYRSVEAQRRNVCARLDEEEEEETRSHQGSQIGLIFF